MLSIPSYTGQSARCFSPCNRSHLYTPPDTEHPPSSLHHPTANPSASFCHNRYISVPRPLCWWAWCLLVCSSRPVTHGLKQKLKRKTARTANKLAYLLGCTDDKDSMKRLTVTARLRLMKDSMKRLTVTARLRLMPGCCFAAFIIAVLLCFCGCAWRWLQIPERSVRPSINSNLMLASLPEIIL